MVQFSAVFLTAIAAFSQLATADVCTPGNEYCGFHLLQIGDYSDLIDAALNRRGRPLTDANREDTLFSCTSTGDIRYVTFCGDNQCTASDRWGDSCPS